MAKLVFLGPRFTAPPIAPGLRRQVADTDPVDVVGPLNTASIASVRKAQAGNSRFEERSKGNVRLKDGVSSGHAAGPLWDIPVLCDQQSVRNDDSVYSHPVTGSSHSTISFWSRDRVKQDDPEISLWEGNPPWPRGFLGRSSVSREK